MVDLKQKLALFSAGMSIVGAAQKLLDSSNIQILAIGLGATAVGAVLIGIAVHWMLCQSVQEALREREDS